MESPRLPRFEATQRREFLKRAAAVGALAAFPALAAACSKGDDADTFADATTTTGSASSSDTTTTGGTTAADDGATTSTPSTTTGDALPDGASMEVAFTFSSGSGGGHNPYIAVWVETPDGDVVANLGVWYDAPKGNRWINNLTSWYTAVSETSSDYLTTTTSATRAAGSYTLSWDGTDTTGARASQGDYVVLIESAVEHGSHSLTSTNISLGTASATASMPDATDLSAATVTYTA